MNNAALANAAYGKTATPARSERSVEYQAFAKVTRAMAMTSDDTSAFTKRVSAIHENRTLWGILAKDVHSDDNELPLELRASIFNLAQFVSRHTMEVLSNDGSTETLVEINKTVMRGLRPNAGTK